jgi:glycogen operon protein
MNPAPAGAAFPLGATLTHGGLHFSVYSRSATAVDLLLFDRVDDARPSRVIPIDPATNRTYHYWHTFVPGVREGQIYGLRVDGPRDPASGLRFDASKVLLDPYAKCVALPPGYSRAAARREGDNTPVAMKSVVVDPHAYDWEGDAPLRHPSSRTIIYEMHVRGLTRHQNSGVREDIRGSYSGVVEKIPYLKALGITAVELLPIFQFDPQDCPPGLVNYWGYQPVSFFAPHQGYSSRPTPAGALDEFRDMVKALHRAGIEVILDVVFNHTAEGDHTGPMLWLRGIDNPSYYILKPDASRYADFTGTGNTLNAANPIVRRMILDSLRSWVEQMHVDGFRFDLASVLSRDESGHPQPSAPILWDIESDPVLAGTKLIAEAWDAAGLYQVGTFVGDSWKEWNGRFRDDVRAFFRAERGSAPNFANRIVGSPDIYRHKQREAEQSINFVTCHDGFTLNDLVSYERKHNDANGENGRDGADSNHSWNCGVEGPTDDPAIERLRNRQVKNLLAATLLSLGVPMILMGDEVRRTQRGNNNAYCLDDESTWLDWSLLHKHADIHRFVSLLLARRVLRDDTPERQRIPLDRLLREANKSWQGIQLGEPDWGDDSHSLALTVEAPAPRQLLHFIFNAYWEPLTFSLPSASPSGIADKGKARNGEEGRYWHRWIDTSLDSPNDIVPWRDAPPVTNSHYLAAPRSVVVLIADSGEEPSSQARALG